MQEFLTSVGYVVQFSVNSLKLLLDTIMDSPALVTICVAMPICGYVVDLLNRLIRL